MTQPSSETARPIRLRPGALAWTEVDDHIVALDLAASEYVELNWSAAYILRLLELGAAEAELVGGIQERCGIDAQRAADDVSRFLEVCRERDWLVE